MQVQLNIAQQDLGEAHREEERLKVRCVYEAKCGCNVMRMCVRTKAELEAEKKKVAQLMQSRTVSLEHTGVPRTH